MPPQPNPQASTTRSRQGQPSPPRAKDPHRGRATTTKPPTALHPKSSPTAFVTSEPLRAVAVAAFGPRHIPQIVSGSQPCPDGVAQPAGSIAHLVPLLLATLLPPSTGGGWQAATSCVRWAPCVHPHPS